MRRGFWDEYWWVVMGVAMISLVGCTLMTWPMRETRPDSINACEHVEHPAPGYCP